MHCQILYYILIHSADVFTQSVSENNIILCDANLKGCKNPRRKLGQLR